MTEPTPHPEYAHVIGDEDTLAPDAQPLCPHCLATVSAINHFCPNCGKPIDVIAATDPLGQVYATGHMYRQLADRRPSTLMLVGIWLLVAPQVVGLFIAGGVMTTHLLRPSTSSHVSVEPSSYLSLALAMGVNIAYCVLLHRVTVRWRRFRDAEAGRPVCPACGYDLRGNPSTHCPECGGDCTDEWDQPLHDDGSRQAVE